MISHWKGLHSVVVSPVTEEPNGHEDVEENEEEESDGKEDEQRNAAVQTVHTVRGWKKWNYWMKMEQKYNTTLQFL